MSRRSRMITLAVLFLLAALVLELPDEHAASLPRPVQTPAATPRRLSAPPRLTASQTNRQDRASSAQLRRAERDAAVRPLIAVLPLSLNGVRISISGVSPDGRRTELEIVPGPRGRTYAAEVYARTLAALGDTGDAYAVGWAK